MRGTPRDIAIKEREVNYFKIKITPFIIFFVETIPLFISKVSSSLRKMHRYKNNLLCSVQVQEDIFCESLLSILSKLSRYLEF